MVEVSFRMCFSCFTRCKYTKLCRRMQDFFGFIFANLFGAAKRPETENKPAMTTWTGNIRKKTTAATTKLNNLPHKITGDGGDFISFFLPSSFFFSCSCSLFLGKLTDWLSSFSFVNLFKLLLDFSFFAEKLKDFNSLYEMQKLSDKETLFTFVIWDW